MEMPYFGYLFLSSTCLAFFWLVYRLFLSNLTFFQWQRMYLLFAVIGSVCLPFLTISPNWLNGVVGTEILPAGGAIPSWLEVVYSNEAALNIYSNYSFSATPLGEVPTKTQRGNIYVWDFQALAFAIFALVYFIGVFIKSRQFYKKIRSILHIIRRNPKNKQGEYWLVEISDNNAAFSFFNYIFLKTTTTSLSKKETIQIIEHEQVHADQYHSFDILLTELAQIIFWFHPAIYTFKSTLKDVHEYIVDATLVQSGTPKRGYAQLLLKLAKPLTINSLTTGFTSKQVGRRIVMLAKSPSNSFHKLKFLLMIPLITSLLLFCSCFGDETLSLNNEVTPIAMKEKLDKSVMFTIDAIDWQGSKQFSEQELSDALNIKVGDRIHSSAFNQRLENIRQNKFYLKDLYAQKGLKLKDVEISRIEYRDASIALVITIQEDNGPGLKIGKILWDGNTVFSDKELTERLGLKNGDDFDMDFMFERLNWDGKGEDVSSKYLNEGYAYFNVQTDTKEYIPGGTVDLMFKIFEGPKVSIAKITFAGNEKMSRKDLLAAIDMEEGELFNRSKIIAAQKTLMEMGQFDPEKIGINTPISPEDNQQMNIEFSLVEIK